jgi:hypothetical protein
LRRFDAEPGGWSEDELPGRGEEEEEEANGDASVRERVKARGVSSRMLRDNGRVEGVTACHWLDVEGVDDITDLGRRAAVGGRRGVHGWYDEVQIVSVPLSSTCLLGELRLSAASV